MLHDKDIREPLFDFLEESYGKIRIIEEKIIGDSRADIIMVMPDAICGIEIKSDADTYTRLAGQVKDYDKFCDMNIVAVGSRHGLHICEHVPPHWGVITVEEENGGADFYFLRKPAKNPNVNPEKKLSLLWRNELAQIQSMNDMPKYKEKSRAFVAKKIVAMTEKIGAENLARQISDILFERDYTLVSETIEKHRKRRKRRVFSSF